MGETSLKLKRWLVKGPPSPLPTTSTWFPQVMGWAHKKPRRSKDAASGPIWIGSILLLWKVGGGLGSPWEVGAGSCSFTSLSQVVLVLRAATCRLRSARASWVLLKKRNVTGVMHLCRVKLLLLGERKRKKKVGLFPTEGTWRAGIGHARAQLCSERMSSHAGQLRSGIFIEALVDEGVVLCGHCATLKHSGDFGANLLFSPWCIPSRHWHTSIPPWTKRLSLDSLSDALEVTSHDSLHTAFSSPDTAFEKQR